MLPTTTAMFLPSGWCLYSTGAKSHEILSRLMSRLRLSPNVDCTFVITSIDDIISLVVTIFTKYYYSMDDVNIFLSMAIITAAFCRKSLTFTTHLFIMTLMTYHLFVTDSYIISPHYKPTYVIYANASFIYPTEQVAYETMNLWNYS